jgi:type II secretory pathway predicted ATPase ExeA
MNLHQLLQRSDRPFLSHPQVGRYFPAASIEDARRRLARSIERGEGPGVLIGAAGTGKSILLQVLAAQHHERFDVVLLACAQMHTRRGLLQAIHFELGLDHQQRDEGELRLSLLEHLLSADHSSHGLLMLVDEAQSLPTQLLEEIRVLGNLARNGVPRVRVVFAGLPSLEERLTSPELDSFNQRLAARCYLAPFARDETAQYVLAQVAVCGADPQQIFASDAWDALFNATDGVPRLVNQLCDRAMLFADDRGLSRIDGSAIQGAWADLQQLPAPENTSSDGTPQAAELADVIEFGSLDGDDSHQSDASVIAGAAKHEGRQIASADFDVPAVNRREMPTDVDKSSESSMPSAQRRPRTFDDCVPEAIDPFTDEFEEEEVVFDRFVPLSRMFHAGTPRVANRRDPALARLVKQALDNKFDASDDRPGEVKNARVVDSWQNSGAIKSARRGIDPGPKSIRLAVVDEATPPDPKSQRAKPIRQDERPAGTAPTRLSPAVTSNLGLSLPSVAALSRATDDPILVIEDEPVRVSRPQSGVRREEYRDLFSRLRHGT